jgi:hypothetical protein
LDPDSDTALSEKPGGDVTVSAVVSRSGENDDSFPICRPHTYSSLGDGPPGPIHEDIDAFRAGLVESCRLGWRDHRQHSVLSDRHRHDQGTLVGVGDGHQDLTDPERLRPAEPGSVKVDRGLSATCDLDVGPANASVASAESLHHRLFTGKPGRVPSRRIGEPAGITSLVLSEATIGEAGIALEYGLDPGDVSQIYSEAKDAHIVILFG